MCRFVGHKSEHQRRNPPTEEGLCATCLFWRTTRIGRIYPLRKANRREAAAPTLNNAEVPRPWGRAKDVFVCRIIGTHMHEKLRKGAVM